MIVEFLKLMDKKVCAFRGMKDLRNEKYNKPTCVLEFILFDDGETYIEFNEQDPYNYHDFSGSARTIIVNINKHHWEMMFKKESGYDEPENLGHHPFC